MSAAPLIIERQEGVLILKIHTPGKRNAMWAESFQALQAALVQAAQDTKVEAIVLAGAHGYFSSGGDLQGLLARRDFPPAERRVALEYLHDLIRQLEACPKPVIAAVEGGAAGAGFSLALACDILIAERNTSFSIAYVKVGLTPDGGLTAFLGQQIPRGLLLEWSLTGDSIPAQRLYELGVINHLAEPGSALEQALALAKRLGAGPVEATAAIKRLVRQAATTPLAAQLDAEAEAMVRAQATAESAEGIGAFLEKRHADFRRLRQTSSPTTELHS